MAGFTTTSNGWVFDLSSEPKKPELPKSPSMATGYLEAPGRWENYSDNLLYDIESRLRQFFESKEGDPKWTGPSTVYRRFTVGMMYQILYGEPWDSTICAKHAVRMNKIMAHYSTKISRGGQIRGKRYSKNIYTLSLSRFHKISPYSLRLRLEWLSERGELPTIQNMRLPKEKLEPGHARNPRTEANMKRRRERAKAAYNERYRDRKH